MELENIRNIISRLKPKAAITLSNLYKILGDDYFYEGVRHSISTERIKEGEGVIFKWNYHYEYIVNEKKEMVISIEIHKNKIKYRYIQKFIKKDESTENKYEMRPRLIEKVWHWHNDREIPIDLRNYFNEYYKELVGVGE